MASFTRAGAPLELPEHLVPPQYKEWDVQVLAASPVPLSAQPHAR